MEDCIRILDNAKSDTERFASLMLVAKLFKDHEQSVEDRRIIFNKIGFQFLQRLLTTEKTEGDCSKWSYKSVAVSILSCFSFDSDIVQKPEMMSSFKELLHIITSFKADTEDEEEMNLIMDTYDCLFHMAANTTTLQAMIEKDTVAKLCQIIIATNFGWERALNLLIYMLNKSSVQIWRNYRSHLEEILNYLVEQFKFQEDEKKFEICSQIYHILCTVEKEQHQPFGGGLWTNSLKETIFILLKNKLGQVHRNSVLKLGCLCLELLGVQWALSEVDSEKKFLLVLVHLCCIEIRISLEDQQFEEIERKGELLCRCFMVVELVISYLSVGPALMLDDKQIRQLHSAMVGACNAVLQFLTHVQQLQQECQESVITIATIRVLGAWLGEETSALQEHVIELLPFLISLCRKNFNKHQAASYPETSADIEDSPDLIRYLLPGLVHLSAEEQARKILVIENAHQFFGQYFSYQFSILNHNDQMNIDSKIALTTLCGIFLNFAVTENELLINDPVFKELLSFLLTNVPSLVGDKKQIDLSFNMATVCLILMRHHSKNKTVQSESLKFFTSVMNLFCCHELSQHETTPLALLKKHYTYYWTDVAELWFLGMQALNSCVLIYPSVSIAVIETKWVQSIIELLVKTEGRGMCEATRESYCGFLFQLILKGGEIRNIISKSDGEKLHELYGLPGLRESFTS